MKNVGMIFSLLAVMLLFAQSALAQDATKVDAKHYKVVFENDEVRVLRINYGAHEKSVMHYHPEGVAIFLTGGKGKFTFPDGTTQNIEWNAGDTIWMPATKHLPENLSDEPFELIQVEMKVQPATDAKGLY